MGTRGLPDEGDGQAEVRWDLRTNTPAPAGDFRSCGVSPEENVIEYWLAIDEQLDSHRFRVIHTRRAYSSSLYTEYGEVSYTNSLPYKITINPRGRAPIHLYLSEEPTKQELVTQLIFWTAKPLFLAVPEPDKTPEQQDTLF